MFCKAKYCSGDQQPRERRLHQRRPPRQLLAHHRPLVFLRHKSLNLTSDSKLPRRNSWSNFNVTKTTFFFSETKQMLAARPSRMALLRRVRCCVLPSTSSPLSFCQQRRAYRRTVVVSLPRSIPEKLGTFHEENIFSTKSIV